MIITVNSSQSEDIAAFAMVKQYRMQALNVTLNGGTGVSAWQAVQGGEGYTQTAIADGSGMALIYEDPNAIVSYTVENDDTSNYDVASNAGIILSSIVPTPTNDTWTYTCVFHADSVPVSNVDIDLLVYGNIARGTEQQGSPATAEEITAQVLEGLETRVTFLENGLKVGNAITHLGTITAGTDTKPIKLVAGVPTAVADALATQTYVSNALDGYLPMVRTTGSQEIAGMKTFSAGDARLMNTVIERDTQPASGTGTYLRFIDKNSLVTADLQQWFSGSGGASLVLCNRIARNGTRPEPALGIEVTNAGVGFVRVGGQRTYNTANTDDVVTIGTLKASTDVVHRSGAETIAGVKTFSDNIVINGATVYINGQYSKYIRFGAENGANQAYIQSASGGIVTIAPGVANGGTKAVTILDQRAYSAANTTDVATIGTLDAYTPMVRTTGNQIKMGKFLVRGINSSQYKNESGNTAWVIFAKLQTTASANLRMTMIISSRVWSETGLYVLAATSASTMTMGSTATNPTKIKIVTDGTSQYVAVEMINNNVKRVTFIDQMDAFDRELPDMTAFNSYLLTTETDVMVVQ